MDGSKHNRTAEIACEHPQIQVVDGKQPGPTVAVLGGVHGNEYGGVLAVRRFLQELRPEDFRGTIRCAAPAHPLAWHHDVRSCPADGLNLARVFPGDPAGQPTERLAAYLTEELIAGSDLVIDLHTAGAHSDMPVLVGYHSVEDPIGRRAASAARAFAAPIIWEHPVAVGGRSLSAAEELGIPSLYVESAGSGQTRRGELQIYLDGLRRVLHHLGMVDDAPRPPYESKVVRGSGNTDPREVVREGRVNARTAGFFLNCTSVASQVQEGELIGELWDGDAALIDRVVSPSDGVVMMIRKQTRTQKGDTLLIVGRLN